MQELKIVIEVFHMVFGAIYQDHFFKFKNFYFSLHPNAHIYFRKQKTLFCFFTLLAFYSTYKCVRSFCLTLYKLVIVYGQIGHRWHDNLIPVGLLSLSTLFEPLGVVTINALVDFRLGMQ